jgi:NADPH:quinone reductase-like Zn-dependent oxidoreductase
MLRSRSVKHLRVLAVQPNLNDLAFVTALCEAGKVVPVIDRRYPLSEVPEALRYLGAGRAKGKVIITVARSVDT